MISQQLSYQAPGKLLLNFSSTSVTQRNLKIGFQPSSLFSVSLRHASIQTLKPIDCEWKSVASRASLLNGRPHRLHSGLVRTPVHSGALKKAESNIAMKGPLWTSYQNYDKSFELCWMIAAINGYSKKCLLFEILRVLWVWELGNQNMISCKSPPFFCMSSCSFFVTMILGQTCCRAVGEWV